MKWSDFHLILPYLATTNFILQSLNCFSQVAWHSEFSYNWLEFYIIIWANEMQEGKKWTRGNVKAEWSGTGINQWSEYGRRNSFKHPFHRMTRPAHFVSRNSIATFVTDFFLEKAKIQIEYRMRSRICQNYENIWEVGNPQKLKGHILDQIMGDLLPIDSISMIFTWIL